MSFSSGTAAHRAMWQYRPAAGAAAVHGEAVVQFEPPAKFQIIAWKGPVAWVTVQMDGTCWLVEFPALHRRFVGNDLLRVPPSLEVWLAARDRLAADPKTRSLALAGRDGSTLNVQFVEPR